MKTFVALQLWGLCAAALCGLESKSRALEPVANEVVGTQAVTPAATPVVTPRAQNFHIYLLMGQSNMVGRDTRTLAAQVDNARVLSLNAKGQWVVARDPIHPQVGRIAGGAGPGIPFALKMLETDPQITIGLVPCAVGGSPLRRWVKGGDLYEQAITRAKVAAQAGTIRGVLWHQGESDTAKQGNAESYAARLTQMFKDLRTDLGSPYLPIVAGQLGDFLVPAQYPYAATVRAAIEQTAASMPNVGVADSTGLGHKGDHLHFSAEAEKELGAHFAATMQQLQKAHSRNSTPQK